MKLPHSSPRATRKRQPTKRKTTRKLPTLNLAKRNPKNKKTRRRTRKKKKRNPSLSSRFKSIWKVSAPASLRRPSVRGFLVVSRRARTNSSTFPHPRERRNSALAAAVQKKANPSTLETN